MGRGMVRQRFKNLSDKKMRSKSIVLVFIFNHLNLGRDQAMKLSKMFLLVFNGENSICIMYK